jgi:hypothetical protein
MITSMVDQRLEFNLVKLGVGIDRIPNRQAPLETVCTKPVVNISQSRSTATEDLQEPRSLSSRYMEQ